MAAAIASGLAGNTEEGAAAQDDVYRLQPEFSIDNLRSVLPFRDEADINRMIDGLRLAGFED
jgi:hypothetical protein